MAVASRRPHGVICGLKMRWQTILPVRFVGGLLGALFVCRSAVRGRPFRLVSARSVYPRLPVPP